MLALPAFADDLCKNLFDSVAWASGRQQDLYKNNSGEITSISNANYSTYLIAVEPNTSYVWNGNKMNGTGINGGVYFLDGDKNWISRITGLSNGESQFTTPANCKYIQLQIGGQTFDFTNMQIERGSTATTYQPYNSLCATCDGTVVVENGESHCVEIKIATTAYNDAQFAPVEQALESAVTTIKDVVANTIVQADAIQNLQDTKQTMPDANGTNGTCPKFRQCLLIETDDGTPQWFQIADPVHDFITAMKNNKVTSSGQTTNYEFAAKGYDGTDFGAHDSRYYRGHSAMRKLFSDDPVRSRQFDAEQTGDATLGGQYRVLGDQEWAETWDGDETGTPNSFLPGVVYGVSRCVKTSESPSNPQQPGTAGWNTIENSDPMADTDNIQEYVQCWCKVTGIGMDGDIIVVNPTTAPWVFDHTVNSPHTCADSCAFFCSNSLRDNRSFRVNSLSWMVQ